MVDQAAQSLTACDTPISSPTVHSGDLRSRKLYHCPCRSHCSEQPQMPICRHRANSRAKARLGGFECHGLWAGHATLGSRLSGADQSDLFIVKQLIQRHENLPGLRGLVISLSRRPQFVRRSLRLAWMLKSDVSNRRAQEIGLEPPAQAIASKGARLSGWPRETSR